MSEKFKPGYISTMIFYVIEGIAILCLGSIKDILPWWLMCIFYIVHFIAFFVIKKGVEKKIIKEYMYKKIQCIVFVILNLILGIVCDSAQVFIYAMFFSTVVILIFLDESLSKFYMKCVCIMMIVIGIGVFSFFRENNTIMDYSVGSIVLIITNVVVVSLCNYIAYQNRKNYEQERSLDDLLKVVEAKCDDARKATRSKSKFLSNVSHEIRTPINAVLGMSEIIIRESEEKDIKKYAFDIKSSAESLLSIINDILDSSKIASGKLEIIPVKYDISSFLNDLYNMINVKAKDKELELVFDIDENIPIEYYGDDIRIRQVVVNLLTNAVKYTKEGKVTFSLSGEVKEDEAILHFSIKDTGIGIKEEDMDKLFQEFERVEEDKNRNIEGTGLGMSITTSLLELMGSSLVVKSEYGVGSEFSFDLVQKVINKEVLGDFNERIKNVAADYSYEVGYIAPDARILIVDDHRTNRNVFCNLLKLTKIKIKEASSGFECLEILEKESFDIIFLDHMMPDMDGIETFHEIKKRGYCPNAPIIMLTANAIKGAREQYLNEGFDDFLTKPIRAEKLDKMVLDYLPKNLIVTDKKVLNDQDIAKKDSNSRQENSIELPQLEEFDFEYALGLLNSEKILISTLEDFYDGLNHIPEKLNDLYDNIADSESLDLYRIEVHSLKSSAAMVGALLLSKIARLLEVAAIDGNIERIKSLHYILLEEINAHKTRLETIIQKKEDKILLDNVNEIKGYLDMLISALTDGNYDIGDFVINEVNKYRYIENIQGLVDDLSKHILNLDAEKALNIIKQLQEL